jgi:hypothetical protein
VLEDEAFSNCFPMVKASEESTEVFHTPIGDVEITEHPKTETMTSNETEKSKEKTITGLGINILEESSDIVLLDSRNSGDKKGNHAEAYTKLTGESVIYITNATGEKSTAKEDSAETANDLSQTEVPEQPTKEVKPNVAKVSDRVYNSEIENPHESLEKVSNEEEPTTEKILSTKSGTVEGPEVSLHIIAKNESEKVDTEDIEAQKTEIVSAENALPSADITTESTIKQEPEYFNYKPTKNIVGTKSILPDTTKKTATGASRAFNPDYKGSPNGTSGGSPKKTNNYQYTPLPKDSGSKIIRVIDLLPLHESALLTLRIRTVDLADNPEYEAISYCWGAPVFDRKVSIEGQGVLSITHSLQGVLKKLRTAEKVRTIWADAICINQGDIDERNAQVQLMRDVYRKCTRVIAWLGEGTNESNIGMDTVPRVLKALRAKEQTRDGRMLKHLPEAALVKYGFPQRNELSLRCLFGIFERPWFQRVWIIQELALAPKAWLLCGDKLAAWYDFFTVTCECWGQLVTSTYSDTGKYSTSVKLGWYFANQIVQPTKEEVDLGVLPNLVNLVARSSAAQATDARDKVFALIGLSKERGEGAGVLGAPDYLLCVEEVYTNFAIENIKTYGNLDVLSLAHRPTMEEIEPDSLDLPSWVPNFNKPAASDPLTRLNKVVLPIQNPSDTPVEFPDFTATHRSVTDPKFSKDNRRLCLKGQVIDVVLTTGDMMYQRLDSEDAIAYSQRVHNTFASWERVSDARSGKRHPLSPIAALEDKGQPLLDVYWHVINGGMIDNTHEQWREEFKVDYLAPMRAYHVVSAGQVIKNRDCFQIVEWVAGWIQDAQNWWRIQWGDHPAEQIIVPGIANCRRVGRTRTGRVTLLPGGARAGDQIALLSGSKVPYVIRKEEEEGVWSLVGEAYVHGIMFGEAWKEETCHDICLD